jgi:hypothetical protein
MIIATSIPSVDASARKSILDYVKPLAVGLDGVTNYGDVERMVLASDAIARGPAPPGGAPPPDEDLLFLLAVFSGQEKWVSRMGHRSRTEIFLGSLGVPPKTVRRLFQALSRFESAPATREEEIVHDALRLEAMGAYGIARGLADAYRERLDILEMADAIEEAAATKMRTEAGERLAEARRALMREFAARLRSEHAEFARG